MSKLPPLVNCINITITCAVTSWGIYYITRLSKQLMHLVVCIILMAGASMAILLGLTWTFLNIGEFLEMPSLKIVFIALSTITPVVMIPVIINYVFKGEVLGKEVPVLLSMTIGFLLSVAVFNFTVLAHS